MLVVPTVDTVEEAIAARDTVARALNATRTVTLPEVHRARASAYVITAAEGGALHLEDLKRRAADWQARGFSETLDDFAKLNARSKFWGDDGRAAFKNWEEVTDPRNPLGGRQGVDERIMRRELLRRVDPRHRTLGQFCEATGPLQPIL